MFILYIVAKLNLDLVCGELNAVVDRHRVLPVQDVFIRLLIQEVQLDRVGRVNFVNVEEQLPLQEKNLRHVNALLSQSLRVVTPKD